MLVYKGYMYTSILMSERPETWDPLELTGVTGSCEPPCVSVGNLGLLQEERALTTADPYYQSTHCILLALNWTRFLDCMLRQLCQAPGLFGQFLPFSGSLAMGVQQRVVLA